MAKNKHIEVWTDGSALNNPGPGGYGILIIQNGQEIEFSKGFKLTTNNRMELLSVIVALDELGPDKKVNINSDSQYVRNGATKWIHGWRRRGWVTSDQKPVKNQDLWKQLYDLLKENSVRFTWVKGHSGIRENELVDQLARDAAKSPTERDDGYEDSL